MNPPIVIKGKRDGTSKDTNKDASKEIKGYIEKAFGDCSKMAIAKQIIIGTTSGWVTGRVTAKVGTIAAFALGGGIVMLQIAVHKNYISINWDKLRRKAEKIADKIEEEITNEQPHLLDKVERFVDRKIDKAEELLRNGRSRTRRWYHSIIGDSSFQITELHYFLASFAAGVAVGIAIP